MDSTEVKITLAEFYAFGIKNQRIYINQDIDFIKAELQEICNTNRLISITTYSATLKEILNFNGENDERYERVAE
jgi:hypothetical protein